MAGVKKYTTHQVIDGVSFADVLKSPEKTKDRVLIWHFPNLWGESQNKEEGYGAYSAILKGDITSFIHGKHVSSDCMM